MLLPFYKSPWFINYKKGVCFCPFKAPSNAAQAYEKAPDGSEEKMLALSIWFGLSLVEALRAKNIDEARKAHNESPPKSLAFKLSRDKWDEYSIVEARNSMTAKRACLIYEKTRPQSKAKDIAWECWDGITLPLAEKAKTVAGYKAVLKISPGEGSLTYKLATEKWDVLAMKKIKKAKTHEEASDAYYLCRERSKVQRLAGNKANDLFDGPKGISCIYLSGRYGNQVVHM